jgi:site-specific DNA-methyltransferase (adenine-specific)
MEIIYKNIDELIPYENNPRLNDEAVEYVKNSIKEFGFKVPIVIDKDNVIIAGHTRIKASKELGIKDIPCIIADDLTEEQVKAFRLANNKVSEVAGWDFDLLNLELDDILDIDMTEFGFLKEEELNIDDFFEEKEGPEKESEEETIICPYCHKEFVKE